MFVVCRLPGGENDLSRSIQAVILALALAWSRELEKHPLPEFYSANIKYRPEPDTAAAEEWVDPYTVLERGFGDCDDMVIWRLAELYKGIPYNTPAAELPAWPAVARLKGTGRYHVLIRHNNGEFEDPAKTMFKRLG